MRYPVDIFQGITIITGSNEAGSPDERLGTACFGNAFYDVDGQAHERYGIATSQGAVVVTRPDGTIGTICALGDGESVSRYFERFVTVEKKFGRDDQRNSVFESDAKTGEVDLEREEGSKKDERVVFETE